MILGVAAAIFGSYLGDCVVGELEAPVLRGALRNRRAIRSRKAKRAEPMRAVAASLILLAG
jgi:hypothetical protein